MRSSRPNGFRNQCTPTVSLGAQLGCLKPCSLRQSQLIWFCSYGLSSLDSGPFSRIHLALPCAANLVGSGNKELVLVIGALFGGLLRLVFVGAAAPLLCLFGHMFCGFSIAHVMYAGSENVKCALGATMLRIRDGRRDMDSNALRFNIGSGCA